MGIDTGTKNNINRPEDYHICPPDYKELGNSSWTFLHSVSAYYPDKPTIQQQTDMKNLIHSTSKLYPCNHCAKHMQEEIKKDPIDVENVFKISDWMCRFHNKVNKELGKPLFDCSTVLKRWKDGFEHC